MRVKPPGGAAYVTDLERFPVRVGRSTKSDLRLDDPFASRLHAELRWDGQRLRLSDLGSGNGTLLNGKRVSGEALVRPGDRIQVGNTQLEVAPDSVVVEDDPPTFAFSSGEHPLPAGLDGPRSRQTAEAVVAAVKGAAGSRPATAEHRQDLFALLSGVGSALVATSDLGEVFDQVLELLFEAVPAERAFVLLRDETNDQLVCRAASFRGVEPPSAPVEAPVSSAIIDEVVGKGRAVLTSDATVDDRFRGSQSILMTKVRSVIAAPLQLSHRVIGMLYLDSPATGGAFREDDLRLLSTLAAIAAIRIENARLLEERLETERIRQQLASAREIQARLQPSRAPEIPGFELWSTTASSFEVGGDYFDLIPLGGSRWLFAIGDVSGKGLDAALLMSSLHASMRAQAETAPSVSELVGRVNRFLQANSPANRYASLFAAALDVENRVLKFVNAGHPPPWRLSADGTHERLQAGGRPVGLFQDSRYEEGETRLAPGDVLVLVTDGITEAMSAAGEELGDEFIPALVQRVRGESAAEILERIEEEVVRFVGSPEQHDDRTLVVLRCTG